MSRPPVRKLRPASADSKTALGICREKLEDASYWAKIADCPSLSRKIRSALKSWGGARRHLDRRLRA